MSYNTDYLQKIMGGGPTGNQVFLYAPPSGSSQADAVATVRGAGYISDAKAKGMRLNDIVIVVDTTTPLVSLSRCSALNATTGAATLTA